MPEGEEKIVEGEWWEVVEVVGEGILQPLDVFRMVFEESRSEESRQTLCGRWQVF